MDGEVITGIDAMARASTRPVAVQEMALPGMNRTRGDSPQPRSGEASGQSAVGRTANFAYGPTMAYARFIVDQESHQVRVEIVDEGSGEVIREIPPENLAKLAAEMRKYEQLSTSRVR